MAKQSNGRPDPLQQLYLARQRAEQGVPPDDDDTRARFPTLFELLTRTWLDDKHRLTRAPKLEIENSVGDWLFRLTIPSLNGFKQVLAKTLSEGFLALEKAVSDASVPWTFWVRRPTAIKEVSDKKKTLDFEK
jgi:hypothetical protein